MVRRPPSRFARDCDTLRGRTHMTGMPSLAETRICGLMAVPRFPRIALHEAWAQQAEAGTRVAAFGLANRAAGHEQHAAVLALLTGRSPRPHRTGDFPSGTASERPRYESGPSCVPRALHGLGDESVTRARGGGG
jgi:hypothetical protein